MSPYYLPLLRSVRRRPSACRFGKILCAPATGESRWAGTGTDRRRGERRRKDRTSRPRMSVRGLRNLRRNRGGHRIRGRVHGRVRARRRRIGDGRGEGRSQAVGTGAAVEGSDLRAPEGRGHAAGPIRATFQIAVPRSAPPACVLPEHVMGGPVNSEICPRPAGGPGSGLHALSGTGSSPGIEKRNGTGDGDGDGDGGDHEAGDPATRRPGGGVCGRRGRPGAGRRLRSAGVWREGWRACPVPTARSGPAVRGAACARSRSVPGGQSSRKASASVFISASSSVWGWWPMPS